jgi:hypothetical protein
MALQRMILVPMNCGKSAVNHRHQRPLKQYQKVEIIAIINGLVFVCIKNRT